MSEGEQPKMINPSAQPKQYGGVSRRKLVDIRSLALLVNKTGVTIILEDNNKVTIIPMASSKEPPAAVTDDKVDKIVRDGCRAPAGSATKPSTKPSKHRQQRDKKRAQEHRGKLLAATVPTAAPDELAAAEEPPTEELAREPAQENACTDAVETILTAASPAFVPAAPPMHVIVEEAAPPTTPDPWKDALEASFANAQHPTSSPHKKKGGGKKGSGRSRR